jgi:hypothetical protein
MPRRFSILFVCCLLAGCTSSGAPAAKPSPFGDPTIDPDQVARHTEQLDEEIPNRPAGSQQEFAAATYLTAHLQKAGYIVELDPVPVSDAVRSTNVVALPPNEDDPQFCVVVGYDSGPAGDPGASVAAFLELARSLRVAVPDHPVEFVALGAEQTDASGGALGARRLIKILEDRELTPAVIEISAGTRSGWKPYPYNNGPVGSELLHFYLPKKGTTTTELAVTPASDSFDKAEVDYSVVTGEPTVVAEKLLEFLRTHSR